MCGRKVTQIVGLPCNRKDLVVTDNSLSKLMPSQINPIPPGSEPYQQLDRQSINSTLFFEATINPLSFSTYFITIDSGNAVQGKVSHECACFVLMFPVNSNHFDTSGA